MSTLRPPKGTYDALPSHLAPSSAEKLTTYNTATLTRVLDAFICSATEGGYKLIETPVIEPSELFVKSTGASSDIVRKEMYSFEDLGGRSLTLRPEGTPGALRALAAARAHERGAIQKVYYHGPMFRYERPQLGRHRQFTQFGMELLGPKAPVLDADLMSIAQAAFTKLGLNFELQIASLGTKEERACFRKALLDYLHPLREALSPESQKRLETNPLRVLDSKESGDQKLLEGAPRIASFLQEESRRHFEELTETLEAYQISYRVNPLLVRGLDYYSDTVFEWVSSDLGAQASVGGGGRYSGLYEELGGAQVEGVGFACGIERLMLSLMHKEQGKIQDEEDLLWVVTGREAMVKSAPLIAALRAKERRVDLHPLSSIKKLKKAFSEAAARRYSYLVILGEKESQRSELTLRCLKREVQMVLACDAQRLHEQLLVWDQKETNGQGST